MAQSVDAETIFEMQIWWNFLGQRLINKMLFKFRPAAPGIPDYQAACLTFANWQSTVGNDSQINGMLGVVSQDALMQAILLQPIAPVRYQYMYTIVANGGGLAGAPMPSNTAQVITKRTVKTGRKWRGSIHLPPPSASEMNGTTGQWTGDHIDALSVLALSLEDPWLDGVAGNEWIPIMWPGPLLTDYAPLDNNTVQLEPRCERRRTVGRGV